MDGNRSRKKSTLEACFENSCAFNSKVEKFVQCTSKQLLAILLINENLFITIFPDTFVSDFPINTV